jgi:hypothetical protein
MGTRIRQYVHILVAAIASLSAVAPLWADPPFNGVEPVRATFAGLQPAYSGLQLTGAWSELPTTPQVPTPPKNDLTAEPGTPSPLDTTSQSMSDFSADTVSTFDSAVGYIDDAIPGTYARFRYDDAYNNNRPSRAEYFYAAPQPFGPGFADFVGKITYQEYTMYLEYAFQPRFSVFIDGGIRALEPQLDVGTSGFGDMNMGFKYAMIYEPDQVMTFQLRTYVPTGDVHDGLSTGHVSIEPGLLYYRQLSSKLRAEAEFLCWVPIGGTDFAGEVLQYGLGLSYGAHRKQGFWLCPVVEAVGWTVLSGKQATGPSPLDVESAAGDDILNIKAGFRVGSGDRTNVYIGYGRALTGDVWYTDILRVEMRVSF